VNADFFAFCTSLHPLRQLHVAVQELVDSGNPALPEAEIPQALA